MNGMLAAVLVASAVQFATAVPARAQEAADSETLQDSHPARAARLTFEQGAVTIETAGAPESQPAQTNVPLLAGTHLNTGDDGQAEVEFEDGSVIRLTPNSTLSLDSLSVDPTGVFTTTATLLRGLAYAELRASSQYHYSFVAGGQVLSPVENVTARINFDEPPARFAILDGSAEIAPAAGGTYQQLHAGETLRASDTIGGSYTVAQGITDESWDAWNADRDEAEAAETRDATTVRDSYAGSQGYGWADLDANGTWYDVPGQGQVWQPAVAVQDAGFDPYGFGAWVWYPSSGYIWASGYRWGWVPFRCGNWNYFNDFGWGWSPAAACGGHGWRFFGSGRPVNISYGPGGYRVPVVPRPRPGPVHPILPTRLDAGRQSAALAGQTGWGALVQHGPRAIGGGIAMPVQTRQSDAALRTGPGRGPSALERDFPVDRTTHAAVLGRVSSQPGLVHTESGWQRTPEPSNTFTGQSGATIFRERQAQRERFSATGNSSAPVSSPATTGPAADRQPSGARPQYTSPASPVQRGILPPQHPELAAPRTMQRAPYLPQPNEPHRDNDPDPGARPYSPPVQRPSYTPPIQQQIQRPSYNPPPQMQAPRYAPPPQMQHSSPPPPRPAASAPAPAGRSPR